MAAEVRGADERMVLGRVDRRLQRAGRTAETGLKGGLASSHGLIARPPHHQDPRPDRRTRMTGELLLSAGDANDIGTARALIQAAGRRRGQGLRRRSPSQAPGRTRRRAVIRSTSPRPSARIEPWRALAAPGAGRQRLARALDECAWECATDATESSRSGQAGRAEAGQSPAAAASRAERCRAQTPADLTAASTIRRPPADSHRTTSRDYAPRCSVPRSNWTDGRLLEGAVPSFVLPLVQGCWLGRAMSDARYSGARLGD